MNLKIAPNAFQRTNGHLTSHLEGDSATKEARELLHKMAVDMVSSSGQVKKGYLKLTRADGNCLRLGTRWSNRADNSTRDAVDYVKSLVSQGFGGSGVDMPAVNKALDGYLKAKSDDRLGTHSFVKLVRDLESAAGMVRDPKDRLELARVKQDASLDSKDFKAEFSSFKSNFQKADGDQARGKIIEDLWVAIVQRDDEAIWTELDATPEPMRESRHKELLANRPLNKIGQQYPLISLNCLREGKEETLVAYQRDLDLQEFGNAKGAEQAAIKHLGISAEQYLLSAKASLPPGEAARTVFGSAFFHEPPQPRHPISEQLRSDLLGAFDRAATLDGFYADAEKLIRAAQEQVRQLDARAQPAAPAPADIRRPDAGPLAQEAIKAGQAAPAQNQAGVAERSQADLAAQSQDPKQLALTGVRRGDYRAAVAKLREIQPPLSASAMARLLVEDHPRGRPANTRLVLFAQAAFGGRKAGVEEMADFAFAAVTLPHQGAMIREDFDASRLRGLRDFAMLMQSRDPAKAQPLAQALARRLSESLPNSETAQSLCTELRAIDPGRRIRLEPSKQEFKFFEEEEEALAQAQREEENDQDSDDEDYAAKRKLQALRKRQENERLPARFGTPELLSRYLDKLQADYAGTPVAEDAKTLSEKLTRTKITRKELQKLVETQFHLEKHVTDLKDQLDRNGSIQVVIDTKTPKILVDAVDRMVVRDGIVFEGSSSKRGVLQNAVHSTFEGVYENRIEQTVNWQGCVFEGPLQSCDFGGANLSGSDLTFDIFLYANEQMSHVSFKGANLDDASMRIDYGRLDEHYKKFGSGTLAEVFDHQRRYTGGTVLTAIASIDDQYAALKVGLMRDALGFIERHEGIGRLSGALQDILQRSPLFLNDPEIHRIAAPILADRPAL